jgi:hypothetical protein
MVAIQPFTTIVFPGNQADKNIFNVRVRQEKRGLTSGVDGVTPDAICPFNLS